MYLRHGGTVGEQSAWHGSGALRRITREPISFGEIEWFGRENVDDEILALLPPCSLMLTENDLHFIDQAFAEGAVSGIRWVRPGSTV